MATFRVPYPRDPEKRQALFEKANSKLSGHGTMEGTPETGTFHGSTIIGRFAGSYRALEDTDEMEIEIHNKPFLVTMGMIEHEAKKIAAEALV